MCKKLLFLITPLITAFTAYASQFTESEYNQLMHKNNCYAILAINEEANEQAITKAFRKLALKYHPDRNFSQKEKAECAFKKINKAWEGCLQNFLFKKSDTFAGEPTWTSEEKQKQQKWGEKRDEERRRKQRKEFEEKMRKENEEFQEWLRTEEEWLERIREARRRQERKRQEEEFLRRTEEMIKRAQERLKKERQEKEFQEWLRREEELQEQRDKTKEKIVSYLPSTPVIGASICLLFFFVLILSKSEELNSKK